MNILLDTNILIGREFEQKVDPVLSGFLSLANNLRISLCIHPISIHEIGSYNDECKRDVILSKLHAYPKLEDPPLFSDMEREKIEAVIGPNAKENDSIDNELLFCIIRNAAHWLVTNDKKMLYHAKKLHIRDRVLRPREAQEKLFNEYSEKTTSRYTPSNIQKVKLYNIDYKLPFFDQFRQDYASFDEWFKKKQQDQLDCWIYKTEGEIQAFLFLQIQNISIETTREVLPEMKRVKISTFKVLKPGLRIGELFIRLSIDYAMENKIDEIFVTFFMRNGTILRKLFKQFGFIEIGQMNNGEVVMVNILKYKNVPNVDILIKNLFPSFIDDINVDKYIVPIKKDFHDRLIEPPGSRDQLLLDEAQGQLIVENHTIRKAYLCNAQINNISKYSIIFFYCSAPVSSITAFGIVRNFQKGNLTTEIVNKIIKNRSVYTEFEIDRLCEKRIVILLVDVPFMIESKIPLRTLVDNGIVKAAPQSIHKLSEKSYTILKCFLGNKYECYSINQA